MVPDFQTLMRPILEMLERADTWTGQALRDEITQRFDLTPEDQQAALPSGRGTQLYSRTQWAITYLSQAQLAAKVRRGVYAITPAGRAFLESAPQRITIGALQQFPTFRDFQRRSRGSANAVGDDEPSAPQAQRTASLDPLEQLAHAFRAVRQPVLDELIERIRQQRPAFLEHVSLRMLEAMGYGKGALTGRSGDRGVDVIVDEDRLGLGKIFVQAKRYGAGQPVGGSAMREFLGSMHQHGATKGVYITTSLFSNEARLAASSARVAIRLIDGNELAELLYDLGVGVVRVEDQDVFIIKRIDEGFFPEDPPADADGSAAAPQ